MTDDEWDEILNAMIICTFTIFINLWGIWTSWLYFFFKDVYVHYNYKFYVHITIRIIRKNFSITWYHFKRIWFNIISFNNEIENIFEINLSCWVPRWYAIARLFEPFLPIIKGRVKSSFSFLALHNFFISISSHSSMFPLSKRSIIRKIHAFHTLFLDTSNFQEPCLSTRRRKTPTRHKNSTSKTEVTSEVVSELSRGEQRREERKKEGEKKNKWEKWEDR